MAKQVIPIRLTGLDGISDAFQSLPGDISLLENMVGSKRTDGGFSFKKRFGVSQLTTSIEGGGTIAAGTRIQSFNDELIALDGYFLYSYSVTLNKWTKKGNCTDIAANISKVDGTADTGNSTNSLVAIDTDCAYANGYICYVESRDPALAPTVANLSAEWFIHDANGELVGSGSVDPTRDCCNVRVAALGTDFYIFFWDAVNTIRCIKIATTAPDVIASGPTSVATNVNTTGIYDVIADVTNTKILLAYRNTTPTLTLMYWLTNMSAGTTQAYATRDPDRCIGFLEYTFANGNGYVAVGTSGAGNVRLLTFPTTTLVVATDVQAMGVSDAVNCTGYFNADANVFITRPGTTNQDDFIMGYNNATGTAWTAMRSVSLQSRPFSFDGTKRYILLAYAKDMADPTKQKSLFLWEVDQDPATGIQNRQGGRITGFLLNDNYGLRAMTRHGLGSFAKVSSTNIVCSAPSFDSNNYSMVKISLDKSYKLGNLTQFNGGLFVPGATGKYYDGKEVVENGFYVRPEAPTLAQGGGGSLTTTKTHQFVLVYSWWDATGRLWRSAPSDVATITLTGVNNNITITVPCLRVTDRYFSGFTGKIVSNVRIEVYGTKPDETNFFLYTFLNNNAEQDTLSINQTNELLGNTEILYTNSGELPNEYPPAPNVFTAHSNRLFAMSGDGSVWHTKEISEGIGAASAALFRVPFDFVAGQLTGMASMDTGLVISKLSKIFLLTGQGPTPDGNSPYQFPVQLPSEVGFANAVAFAAIKDGILFKSLVGWMIVTRAGTVEFVEGSEAYNSFTVTGSVSLDNRPYAIFAIGSLGTALVYDWQLKLWYAWTNLGTLVSIAKWQSTLVELRSNGTVEKEVASQYNDDGSNIQSKMIVGYVNIPESFANCRLCNAQFLLDCKASFTLSVQLVYDYTAATLDPARTKAVTASDKGVFVVPTSAGRGRSQSVQITVLENSQTQGFEISSFALEIQMKQGARKQPTSRFLV